MRSTRRVTLDALNGPRDSSPKKKDNTPGFKVIQFPNLPDRPWALVRPDFPEALRLTEDFGGLQDYVGSADMLWGMDETAHSVGYEYSAACWDTVRVDDIESPDVGFWLGYLEHHCFVHGMGNNEFRKKDNRERWHVTYPEGEMFVTADPGTHDTEIFNYVVANLRAKGYRVLFDDVDGEKM